MSRSAQFASAVSRLLPGCRLIAPDAAELLGAPLDAASAATSIRKKAAALHDAQTRLSTVDRHDALTLLRISLGHPRAVYILRSAPLFDLPELSTYDSALRESAIVCLNIRANGSSWTLATLSPKKGDLGLMTPSKLALPEFLASSAAVSNVSAALSGVAPDLDTQSAHSLARDNLRRMQHPRRRFGRLLPRLDGSFERGGVQTNILPRFGTGRCASARGFDSGVRMSFYLPAIVIEGNPTL